MNLQPIFVAGSSAGLETDKKPFLLTENAFQQLNNAYAWRERIKKRNGLRLLGRLRRTFSGASLGNSGASPWTFNIYSTLVPAITPEANAEIASGSVTITIGVIVFTDFDKTGSITNATQADPCQITSAGHNLTTGDVIDIAAVGGMTELNGNTYQITVVDANNFTLDNTDSTNFTAYTAGGTWTASAAQGNGILVSTTGGNSGTINYLTGDVTLTHTAGAGVATTISFGYYPALPVMGIYQREQSDINDEQTVFFDTTYAYIYSNGFTELATGTSWDGTDADFFWCTNYRGTTDNSRLFFVTNFVDSATVPMRYYDGTWNAFTPQLNAGGALLVQAKILIPYYGRLLALNTIEGTALGDPGNSNYFNRCRFSQIGNPLEAYNAGTSQGAWAEDIFGKGGFIDAPTNEAIVSAAFNKNTLIVGFERSTWQLRYVGEYGLPFLWERISSDFGTESTFSSVLFDEGVLSVGDKAITTANAVGIQRIDTKIPDFVFNIRNAENGINRVIGVRDYEKELVYWTIVDSNFQNKFPNQVLVYNYRNNTFATFRDNVTFFGTFQPELDKILWGRFDIFWNSFDVFWRDPETQSQFPFIVSGNQQGFVHYYMDNTIDEESLAITDINVGVTPVQLTIPDHNLRDEEIIRVTGVSYSTSTDLNDRFYNIQVIDADTIALLEWDSANQQYVNVTSTSVGTYLGNGVVSLHPVLYVATKDFNPYQQTGQQMKLAYVDFQMDATESASMTVQVYVNASPAVVGNLLVGNTQTSTSLTTPFYTPMSTYAWHRFYATVAGQYVTLVMTYDDEEMNTLATHEQAWELNAFTLWTRSGSRNW